MCFFFFFQAEDGIRDLTVTGVQTCALPIYSTDANGIARVGSWTLATTAGANTLTATSAGLTGSPVTFTATGTAGSAGSIAVSAGDQQTATVNTAVATPPAVIVKDQFGNPVGGAAVTFAIASGQGGITGAAHDERKRDRQGRELDARQGRRDQHPHRHVHTVERQPGDVHGHRHRGRRLLHGGERRQQPGRGGRDRGGDAPGRRRPATAPTFHGRTGGRARHH